MNNNQEQMKEIINDLRAGDGDKESFCKAIQKDVNCLVYPVFGDDYKKISAKAIINVCDKLEDIDVDKNIMRQIATMVSVYMFGLIDSSTVKLDDYEYEYSKIREDSELFSIVKANSKIFKDMKAYDMAPDNIENLSRMQTIMMELYGYEMHSVEEIKELLGVDSTFVSRLIATMRENLLGNSIDSLFASNVEPEPEEEEYHGKLEIPGLEPVVQDDNEDDDEEADSGYEEDDDSDEGVSFEYDMDEYGEEPEYPKAHKKSLMDRLTDCVGRVFPKVPKASRKNVVYTALVLIVVIVILVVSIAAFAGSSRRKVKKTRSEWTPIEYTSKAQKETATSKENASTEASKDSSTEAVTEKTKETEKTEEATQRRTTADNNRAADNNNTSTDNNSDDNAQPAGDNNDNTSDDNNAPAADDNNTSDDSKTDDNTSDDKTDSKTEEETKPTEAETEGKTEETKPAEDKTESKAEETKPAEEKTDSKTDDKSDNTAGGITDNSDKAANANTSTEN